MSVLYEYVSQVGVLHIGVFHYRMTVDGATCDC